MTGVLHGVTLLEKMYGPGFRDAPHRRTNAPWAGCGIEGCSDPVYGSVELYVDDVAPVLDWYSRLLSKLPQHVWTEVRFCQGHLADVTRRSTMDLWETPDLWAPWRASPPVLTHPVKLLERPTLVVAKG